MRPLERPRCYRHRADRARRRVCDDDNRRDAGIAEPSPSVLDASLAAPISCARWAATIATRHTRRPERSRSPTCHARSRAIPPRSSMPPAPSLPRGPWNWSGAATNTAFAGPWGVSFTANLTPDVETGLGAWTEEMFIATMKTGRHQGKGRPLLPPMPFENLGGLNDEDIRSVLRSCARFRRFAIACRRRSIRPRVSGDRARLVVAAVVVVLAASGRVSHDALAAGRPRDRRHPALVDTGLYASSQPGVIDDSQPAVHAAVSVVVGWCSEGALDLSATGNVDRRLQCRRLGVSGRHALLEGVHLQRAEGGNAVAVEGVDKRWLRRATHWNDAQTDAVRPRRVSRASSRSARPPSSIRRPPTARRAERLDEASRFHRAAAFFGPGIERDSRRALRFGMVTLRDWSTDGCSHWRREGLVACCIVTANPRTRSVLADLLANCGSCDDGAGEIAALVLGPGNPRPPLGRRPWRGTSSVSATRGEPPGVAEKVSVLSIRSAVESGDAGPDAIRRRRRRRCRSAPSCGIRRRSRCRHAADRGARIDGPAEGREESGRLSRSAGTGAVDQFAIRITSAQSERRADGGKVRLGCLEAAANG